MSATTGYGSRTLRPRKRAQAESEGESEALPSSNVPKKAKTGEGEPEAPIVARPAVSSATVFAESTDMATHETTDEATTSRVTKARIGIGHETTIGSEMQDAETATINERERVPVGDDDQLSAYLKASRSSLSMSDATLFPLSASAPPQATTSPATHEENTDELTDEDAAEVKEATETEKQWWFQEKRIRIDESRLPLCLVKDVTYRQFIKKCEATKTRRFWDYRDGAVIVIELPTGGHEGTHSEFSRRFMSAFSNAAPQDDIRGWGAKSLYTNLTTNLYEEPDACYVPRRLLNQPNPVANPCDHDGNPWPTIIVEVASSETLEHVVDKLNTHWLAPGRCEDVIVFKLGNWKERRRDQTTRRPLRRLRCLRFCRRATLQLNANATAFAPIQEIEFGSVHANGRQSFFCTGNHMKWLIIDRDCIFAGCPQPPPLPALQSVVSAQPLPPNIPNPLQVPGVAIDLYDIQQAIFDAMGPN